MTITELIRQLNSLKKKHPAAPVYIFGDSQQDLELIKHIAVCSAPTRSVQEGTVTQALCQKDLTIEDTLPVIVLG